MWKRFIKYCQLARRQLLFYILVGGSGTLLDLATLALFKEVFGWRPVMAVIVNQIICINYVFFLNKFFTFCASGRTFMRLRNFLFLSSWNYLFAIVWMYVLNEIQGYHYLAVRVSSILLAVSWNFVLYKYWIYRPLKNKPESDTL